MNDGQTLDDISDEELGSIVRELLCDGEYIRKPENVLIPRRGYRWNK